MCLYVFAVFTPPVKSDVGWVTMTGVPPTIPSGEGNCSANRNSFHFSCLPARKLSERHFTVCVRVQWSLFFSPFFQRRQVFLSWHNLDTWPLLISVHERCQDLVLEVNPVYLKLLYCPRVCMARPVAWWRWCTWISASFLPSEQSQMMRSNCPVLCDNVTQKTHK